MTLLVKLFSYDPRCSRRERLKMNFSPESSSFPGSSSAHFIFHFLILKKEKEVKINSTESWLNLHYNWLDETTVTWDTSEREPLLKGEVFHPKRPNRCLSEGFHRAGPESDRMGLDSLQTATSSSMLLGRRV